MESRVCRFFSTVFSRNLLKENYCSFSEIECFLSICSNEWIFEKNIGPSSHSKSKNPLQSLPPNHPILK